MRVGHTLILDGRGTSLQKELANTKVGERMNSQSFGQRETTEQAFLTKKFATYA